MLVSEVSNLCPTSKPPSLVSSVLLKRIDTGKKSIIKERVTFPQVYDINRQGPALRKPSHSEKEPLRITLGVYVIL